VYGVLPKPGAVFLEFEFLAARLSPDRVVIVARLLANQENGFRLLLALGHQHISEPQQAAPREPENVIVLDRTGLETPSRQKGPEATAAAKVSAGKQITCFGDAGGG
jgi:hypothetical protein